MPQGNSVLHPETLIRQLEQRVAVLNQALEVTRSLAAEKSLDHFLELMMQNARAALACEVVSVFLFDEERQELYTPPVIPLNHLDEIRLSMERGIVGRAAREKQTVYVADPYNHPEFCQDFDKLTGFRTRNLVATPLLSCTSGQLLGVMEVINRHDSQLSEADTALIETFAAHAAIALERALYARHYQEKLRLDLEMEAANKIQSYFFPAAMPNVPGYELAARSRPAAATGGDYYDVISLCDQRLGLVIGDVCGHGLGPSLLMAAVRATLRSLALREHTPHALLTDLNQVMHNDMGYRQRFTTMIYGILDPARHQFLYGNAGHGPLTLHYQAQSGQFHVLPEQEGLRGFPLGITDDCYVACPPVDLAPGDLLILGSDGIIESRRNGELFGMERFRRILAERLHLPLAQTVDELFARSLAFSGAVQPQDDLTLLLVRRI